MIEVFNNVEVRDSGVIYNSVFDQIKKMYLVDPEKAGELAISAIELILTGQISSDDVMIDMLLTPAKVINDNNMYKYDMKVENSRQKKIREMRLQEIAEFYEQGLKQREIGERLKLSQQIVSYRINLIKTNYPELLQKNYKNTKKDTNILQTENKNTNTLQEEICTNFVQKDYKNTNDTKIQNFVQKDEVCKEEMFVKNAEVKAEEQPVRHFVF